LNFVLGVGAQRCGTTWLAEYLARHPQVFMTPYKELHVFDAMFASDVSGYTAEKRFSELHQLLGKLIAGQGCSGQQLAIAVEKYTLSLSANSYLSYFKRYAKPEHRAMGEITPSYSLLPVSGFAFVRQLLLGANLRPRLIFIMRDPVSRLYSQLRFNQRRGVAAVKDSYATALSTPGITMRTRYDRTVTHLQQVFSPDELLFLFYEELFRDESISAVCAFLGIDPLPADFTTSVNATPDLGAIDPDFGKAARAQLDEVYQFCAAQFGSERIRSIWPCF